MMSNSDLVISERREWHQLRRNPPAGQRIRVALPSPPTLHLQSAIEPQSVAVADFNTDGNLDLVTTNLSFDVSVLLGNGEGGFEAKTIPVDFQAFSVAVGDFNRDGRPDLVTANTGFHRVSVLLGDGEGGFDSAPGSPFLVGEFPESVAVGDFDGNGHLDVATAISFGRNVSVLLGDEEGGFDPSLVNSTLDGNFPESVAVGDFDGDGHLDVATANSGSDDVSVLLGERGG